MKYIDSYAIFEYKHDVNIIEELESGYCEFYYRKADGSKRHAYGTLKQDFLKHVWKSKSEEKKDRTTGMILYWDIEKKSFRTFHKDLFIGLEFQAETLKEFLEEFPELKKKVKKAKENFIEETNEESNEKKSEKSSNEKHVEKDEENK